MSNDAPTESSPVNVEDLFYSTEDTPQPDSTPGPEGDTSLSAETEEVEETAPTSEVGEIETTEEPNAPKPRSNAEKRIAELLAENKRLKLQAPRAETKPPEPKPADKAAPAGELKVPQPGEFETWDAYQKARDEFVKKQIEAETKLAIEADRAERDKQSAAAQQQQLMTQAKQAWDKQVAATEKRHSDFKQKVFETVEENGKKLSVLRSDIPMNTVLDDFIPKSPIGGEILYHLTTLPAEEAERIRGLQGYDALRDVIALEAKLTEALKAPPKTSTLKPPRQVTGSGARPTERPAEEVFYGSD